MFYAIRDLIGEQIRFGIVGPVNDAGRVKFKIMMRSIGEL
jgi:hypothetical protein